MTTTLLLGYPVVVIPDFILGDKAIIAAEFL